MNPIIALEPKTQRMLTGPSAPREDQMEEWLNKHPSFHLVMPREVSTSKFYGNKKPQPVPRAIKASSAAAAAQAAGSKTTFQLSGIKTSPTSGISLLSSPSPEKKQLSSPSSEYQILRNAPKYSPTPTAAIKSQSSQPPPMPQKPIPMSTSQPPKRSSLPSSSSSGGERRKSTVQRGETSYAPPPAPPPVDPRPIRENAKKGLKDALKTRIAKAESDEHRLSEEKLAELVRDVEGELYRLYNKDVGPRYKNKYRSLVFNLKDEKNLGLFRKVVTRRIGPRALVAMTAEELASKELKEWRQAEQKGEIEKIRAHELDLAKQGNKFVIKTHKGDQIVDVDDNQAGGEKKPGAAEEVKLPEEMPDPEKKGRKDSKSSSRHDDHRSRDKESGRDRDRHRSRDHHRHSGSKERSSEGERHRHRSKESGKDGDKERKEGKDRDREKRHSSSSSSRDKDRHRHHRKSSSSQQQHKSSSSREKESREEREEREKKKRAEKEEAETKKRKEEAEREEEARKKALAEKADKVLLEFQVCLNF